MSTFYEHSRLSFKITKRVTYIFAWVKITTVSTLAHCVPDTYLYGFPTLAVKSELVKNVRAYKNRNMIFKLLFFFHLLLKYI